MIKFLLLTLLSLSTATPVYSSSAKIYVWQNATGVLEYSHKARSGAKAVETEKVNVIPPSSNIKTQTLDINNKHITEEYQVVINHPKANSTIRDNTGSVYISGSIKPLFKRGLNIQLLVDEKPHLTPKTQTIFSLHNIDRGEHKIQMKLLDENGKVIAKSKQITFYMHRTSIN